MITTVVQDYFAPEWRSLPLDCACGWQGDSAAMQMQPTAEASTYACPQCSFELLVVVHPDLDQVCQAAARGHDEAIEQLALLEEARAFLDSRESTRD